MRTLISIKERLPLILILAAGAALRIAGLSFRSFFADEIFMVKAVQNPLSALFAIDAPHGPIPFYILHFLSGTLGPSEFWMRFPSAIAGILTCYLIYKIAEELTDKRTALIATALSAFSPFLILYDQTARWYSLFAFTATASAYFFLRNMKFGKNFDLFAFSIMNVLLLYIEPTAIFFIGFEVLAAAVLFKSMSKKVIAAFVTILIAYIPMVLTTIQQSDFYRFLPGTFAERGVGGGILFRLFYAFYSFSVGQTISPFNLPVAVPAISLFFLLFSYGLIKGAQKYGITAAFLCFYLLAAILQAFTQLNLPHYMMYAAVPFVMIISIGLEQLRERRVLLIISAVIISSVYAYSLHNLFSGKEYNRMEFVDDWKGIADHVVQVSAAGDLVVHSSDSFDYYCRDRKKITYGKDPDRVINAVAAYHRSNPETKVVFVYSPLSGLFVQEVETGQKIGKALADEYRLESRTEFCRDPEYLSKRKFVKRSFPEYRISVSIYSKGRTNK